VGRSGVLSPDLPDKDVGSVPKPVAGDPVSVRLARPEQGRTADQLLWTLIRNRTNAISFNNYFNFVNRVLCGGWEDSAQSKLTPEFGFVGELRNLGGNGYEVLKSATELFLQHEAGIIVNPVQGGLSNGSSQALQQMYDPFISPEAELVRRNFDQLPADWVDQLRNGYYDKLSANTPVLPYFTQILNRLQELAPKGGDEIFTSCYGGSAVPSRIRSLDSRSTPCAGSTTTSGRGSSTSLSSSACAGGRSSTTTSTG
jgi:hypothetical protein